VPESKRQPYPSGGQPPKSSLTLSVSELRQVMSERLSRHDVGVLWYDLFNTVLDDDLPRCPLSECVIELLSRAGRHDKMDVLLTNLRRSFPHVLALPDGPLAPAGEVTAYYMSMARRILEGFSNLQLLLTQNNINQAEEVTKSVIQDATLLYNIAVSLRSCAPEINSETLAALDDVYTQTAKIFGSWFQTRCFSFKPLQTVSVVSIDEDAQAEQMHGPAPRGYPGKRERLAHATADSLAQGQVEALHRVGQTAAFDTGNMLLGRDDREVGVVKVGVNQKVAIGLGQLLPEFPTGFSASVGHDHSQYLTTLKGDSDPYPGTLWVLLAFPSDKGPEFI
jgi:hypothetical protein